MFLFDIPEGNYIEVVAYQRDLSVPIRHVTVSSENFDGYLDGTFETNNKSDHIQGNVARIYKNDNYNAVIFSRHRKIPCIFCVPNVELYHKEKMRELFKQFQKYYNKAQIPQDVMQIIQKLILPHTYD